MKMGGIFDSTAAQGEWILLMGDDAQFHFVFLSGGWAMKGFIPSVKFSEGT